MPKCSHCGRKGIFLKLSPDGFCASCQRESDLHRCVHCGKSGFHVKLSEAGLCYTCQAKENQRKRSQYIEDQIALFSEKLVSLPRYSISFSEEQPAKDEMPEIPEFRFSNITSRTNYDKLGDFVVVDTETTGLRSTSAILEVSAIRFINYSPTELFTTLIRPARYTAAAEKASEINGITKEMVSDAPRIWQVISSLSEFIGDFNIVGHNLEFDLQFLCRDGLILSPKSKLYDTLSLAKHTLKRKKSDYDSTGDVENYKLATVCLYYDIFWTGAHRSSADCLATGKLFQALAKDRTGN